MLICADTLKPEIADPTAVDFDPRSPKWYLNRELSWLNFNRRVLHEAGDERTPLLERLKFFSIVSANLDEFFMKRIGDLKGQLGAGVQDLTVDGRSPGQQLDECNAIVRELEAEKDALLPPLLNELAGHDLILLEYEQLTPDQQARLRDHYFRNIMPRITPQPVDPASPFPFIANLSLNLLVTLRPPAGQSGSLVRVKVPAGSGIPRFLPVDGRHHYVRLEAVMAHNLDLLFPGMRIDACELFHVTRNANTGRDEANADDRLALIEPGRRTRRFAPVVRLVTEHGMDPKRRGRLARALGLDEAADVFERRGILAARDFFQLAAIDIPELHDPPHHPIDHPLLENTGTVFQAIRQAGAILLHHPYEAFTSSVERFLGEASCDPDVRAIQMTLYRTSNDTQVMRYLIDAARNGKQVAVLVELKARFDEAANIRWANRLEAAGIHVTHGRAGLKTHCKAILVVRQEDDGPRRYAHVGTGNYHAGTARLYTDLGLLTCDPAIGDDLTGLFHYLATGNTLKRRYRKILPSPQLIKTAMIGKIRREVEHLQAGRPARIQFKMNALEDPDITRELYLAARAGLKIDLVVRDSCRLRPGIPGLSDNITVVSIVGRFLEHSRIYYFRNGGDEEYFIGSADMMTRNLEQRVEILAPVEPAALKEELRTLLAINLCDRRNAWDMQSDGSYRQRQPGKNEPGCQERLIALAAERRRSRTSKRRPGNP